MPHTVEFTCMTTKKKFEVNDPDVVVLKNGRFAYRAECPWEGKNGRSLVAMKFCSTVDHERFVESRDGQKASRLDKTDAAESEHDAAESEHDAEIA